MFYDGMWKFTTTKPETRMKGGYSWAGRSSRTRAYVLPVLSKSSTASVGEAEYSVGLLIRHTDFDCPEKSRQISPDAEAPGLAWQQSRR